MDGSILDGDGNVVFEGDGENLIICNHCLVKKFEKITEEVKEEIVEEIEEDVSKKKLLKKIKNMKDEDEFIKNIGYVGRDNFTKVYKESLVDHYYPIDAAEDDKELDIMSFNSPRTASVIYTVFASVPQVKRMKIFVNEKDNDFAFANEDLFEE